MIKLVYVFFVDLQETMEDIDKDKDGFISLEEYIGNKVFIEVVILYVVFYVFFFFGKRVFF